MSRPHLDALLSADQSHSHAVEPLAAPPTLPYDAQLLVTRGLQILNTAFTDKELEEYWLGEEARSQQWAKNTTEEMEAVDGLAYEEIVARYATQGNLEKSSPVSVLDTSHG